MKELELYLHIPFCVQKCDYCDFLSAPAKAEEMAVYVKALGREIKSCRERFAGYQVTSVFFGGGTPSILEASQMQELTDALYQSFDILPDAEVTLEMNPGTVSMEKLAGYKKAGINRLSIGLQSADDAELRTLGRIHDFRMFLDTYEMARKAGFENLNVDLISAIPGQTHESWNKTLHTVAGLGPEHISAYSLIIEEGTPFYDRYGDEREGELPDEEEERRMYKDTGRILEEYGYHRYEISNYAKPGFACRHNLGYWERKEYLGMGTGASSLIGNVRYDHIRETSDYIGLAETPEALMRNVETLDKKAQMEEFMFLGLRKTDGIRADQFLQMFGCEIEEVYGEILRRLAGEKLLSQKNGNIFLTERGIDISNYVLSQFLL